ncbi:MAG: hypothetical protein JXQ30_16105 [Spirochaetes bacterium]|nr:hypothetical protein [Spirochaetota bacterium]
MPKLVKGGKWVYGWSVVGMDCRVLVPPDARDEYGFALEEDVLVMSGSRRSMGFAVTTEALLSGTPFQRHFEGYLEFLEYYEKNSMTGEDPRAVFSQKGKALSRVFLDERGCLQMWRALLERYGVSPFDRLLGVRGSGIALGFVVKGPIVKEAEKHPEIRVFEEGANANL